MERFWTPEKLGELSVVFEEARWNKDKTAKILSGRWKTPVTVGTVKKRLRQNEREKTSRLVGVPIGCRLRNPNEGLDRDAQIFRRLVEESFPQL